MYDNRIFDSGDISVDKCFRNTEANLLFYLGWKVRNNL